MQIQLGDADLSDVNTILQKYGLHLVFIMKENLLFHFHMNSKIDEEGFVQAFCLVVLDLFRHNVDFLGRIKLLEMKLELTPNAIEMNRKYPTY